MTKEELQRENTLLKEERTILLSKIDKLNEDLKKVRIAFIQSEAVNISNGRSFNDFFKGMDS